VTALVRPEDPTTDWPVPIPGEVVVCPMPETRAARGQMNVYFVYDHDWDLLYIGQTGNVRRRLMQHRRADPWWWEDAAFALVMTGNTRDEAATIERSTIEVTNPPGNHHYRRRHTS